MSKTLIKYSRTQPARMILAIAAYLTFIAGLWIITPWYLPLLGLPAVSTALSVSLTVGGIVNCLATLPALYGVKKNCPKALARGAFYLFLWYMFVTLTRIIFNGFFGLGWVGTMIIALIMAVVYIEQRYVASTTTVHESND